MASACATYLLRRRVPLCVSRCHDEVLIGDCDKRPKVRACVCLCACVYMCVCTAVDTVCVHPLSIM